LVFDRPIERIQKTRPTSRDSGGGAEKGGEGDSKVHPKRGDWGVDLGCCDPDFSGTVEVGNS